jgi:tartrate-resistant acid phosphatase type 5
LNVDSDNIRFLILGDWGGKSSYPYRTVLQKNISQQMTQMAARQKSQFIVTLGNNFFDSGVKNINDFRFQVDFFLLLK